MILHSFKQGTPRQTAFGIVLLLFTLSIIIRFPNLNRPISKHYEFNTAVILINIVSWRQAGGGDHFHYTPVMNFQNAGDKLPPNNLNIDNNGNTVYLSFGPGFFVIPYFFYQMFHLPAIPLYLEILNLLFHLASILLFFYLMEQLIPSGKSRKYSMIIAGCSFMIFSPGMLWFLGNGYINTGIMLPFLLGVLLLLLPMLQDPSRISAGRLSALLILIVFLVYIDWYILFLSFLSILVALYKWRKNNKYGWLAFVLVFSVASGIVLIFFQFASHMGREAVVDYWLRRSSERSMNLAGSTIAKRFSLLMAYFLTSYFPLLLVLLISFLSNRRRKIFPDFWGIKEIIFIRLLVTSLIFYNLFLFNWSTDHEFTILPWALLLCFVAARFAGAIKNNNFFRGLLALFMICSIGQYYYINRPGYVSRDGMPYASFKQLGDSLKQIRPDYAICINLEQNPMVEYYAARNILRLSDSLSAIKSLEKLGIKKAVWITQKNYKLENIKIIN